MQGFFLIVLFAFETEKLFTFVGTNPLENTETENKYQRMIERQIKRMQTPLIDLTKRCN